MPRPPKVVPQSWFAEEWGFYAKTAIVSVLVFGGCYAYLKYLGIPGELNKSAADTAIILMGWSMLLSSVCYFWNTLDWAIVYRKYLGLVGFAFAIAHMMLSWEAIQNVLQLSTWQKGAAWPVATGGVAMLIFTVMALISNTYAATMLGGKWWRWLLRTGYVAIVFVWLHVVLLKSARWWSWYQGGMKTLPSLSFIVTVFMIVVLLMRLALWWSLTLHASKVPKVMKGSFSGRAKRRK